MFKDPMYLFAIAQFVLFVPILLNFLLRVGDKFRFRFFILATCYFVFNLFNLLVLKFYNLESGLTNIVVYLGGYFIALALLHYIIKEFRIFELSINRKNVLLIGVLVITTSFLTTMFLIGTSEIARIILVILPIISTTLFSVYFHVQYYRHSIDERLNGIFLIAGYISLILITAIPLLFHFGFVNEVSFSLINITYIVFSIGYFFQLLSIGKQEQVVLRNFDQISENLIDQIDFTPREYEIAKLLLEGKSFDQIADNLFISTDTVYKHASNIYKKAGCKNRKEFSKKFRKPR